MSKFKYFELSEFVKSDTAQKFNINNEPTFEVVEHLAELTKNILEPLRDSLGKPVKINSGYRCQALNKKVGGVASSVHQLGYAADIVCPSIPFESFRDFVVGWLTKNAIKFDQCLIEKSNGNRWIHLGLYDNTGKQRCYIGNITV